jgi:lysophospholipase L1-like esterase
MLHKPIIFGSLFFVSIILLLSCKGSESVMVEPDDGAKTPKAIKYLALGDSYTKGESVMEKENFPHQLIRELQKQGEFEIEKLQIIAETGWTTTNLISAINTSDIKDTFDLVTLLIGVNNQFQNLSIEEYEQEFLLLLQKAIGFAGNNKSKVLVLSIPDYGATPFGQTRAALIGKEINRFNAVNKNLTTLAGVAYVDVTEISRQGSIDGTLVAEDNLHPSGKMYKLWVDKMLPVVRNQMK